MGQDRYHDDADDGGAGAADDCTTTGSFDGHGIDDGSELIRRTHYRLVADGDDAFEPTERFFDRLADAFSRAYLIRKRGRLRPLRT